MSTLPAIDEVERAVRGVAEHRAFAPGPTGFDEAVRGFRAIRSPDVEEKRKNARLSIAELNEMDADEIHDKLQFTNFDNRGPVTKFLDLLDAPRNFIAGHILAPAVRRRKESEGERGAFGEGKVLFSDVLGEMGMRPGIVRGVLGFVGDVATDPLTYVGGAGVGAKLTTKAGQTVNLGRQGARAARGAIKAVGKGAAIEDPLFADLYRGLALDPALDAGKRSEALSKAIYGEQIPKGTGLKRFRSLALEKIKGIEGAGGVAESAYSSADDALTRAGKAIIARYGQGAPVDLAERAGSIVAPRGLSVGPKGINIGNAASQIAHIPFTEIGLNVPAFTQNARIALANRAASMVKGGKVAQGVWLMDAADHAQQLSRLADHARDATMEAIDATDPVRKAELEQIAGTLQQAKTQARESFIKHMNDAPPDAFQHMSLSDMIATNRMRQAAVESAQMADAEAKALPFYDFLSKDLANDELRRGLTDATKLKGIRDTLLKGPESAAPGEILEHLNEIDNELAMVDPHGPQAQMLRQRRAGAIAEKQAELAERAKRGVYGSIMRMSDTDIERAAAEADRVIDSFTAKWNFARLANGTVVSQLNSPERVIADAAKQLLGLGPDDIGASLFGTPRSVIASALNIPPDLAVDLDRGFEKAGAGLRSVLGNRRAKINEARRMHEALVRYGPGREVHRVLADRFLPIANKVVADYGLKTDEQKDAMMAVAHAMLYERHLKAKGYRFPERWRNAQGVWEDAPLKQQLQKIKDGTSLATKLDPDRYAAMVKDLEPMVDEAAAILEQLDGTREAYIPIASTRQFQRLIDRSASRGERAAQAAGAPGPLQAFEKSRSSDVYQWADKNGEWHQLFEYEFGLADKYRDPERMTRSGLPAEVQSEIKKTIAEVDRFRADHPGLTDEMRRVLLAKNADPYMLNSVNREVFLALHGGNPLAALPPSQFPLFSDNLLHVLSERLGQQAIANSRDGFRQLLDMGIPTAQEAVKRTIAGARGDEFEFVGSGIRGQLLGDKTIKIGDIVYRPLRGVELSKLDEPGLTQGLLNNERLERLYPVQVAEQIERMSKVAGEEATGAVARAVDAIGGAWKSSTLFHPAWTAFNLIGDMTNWAIGGIPFTPRLAEFGRHAAALLMKAKGLGEAQSRSVVLNGVRHNLDEVLAEYERSAGAVKAMEPLQHMRYGHRYAGEAFPESLAESAKQFGPRVKKDYQRAEALNAAQYAAAKSPDPFTRFKIGAQSAADERIGRRVIRPWFAANAAMQDAIRFSAYLTLLDKGESAASAAAKIRETFYDFADMTNSERWTRRWVFPFFSWFRNNGAYQMRRFLQDPKWAAMVPKVKEMVEEAIDADEQLPEHIRPTWLREQLALQLGKAPDSRYALGIGTAINTEPVNQVGGALAGGGAGLQNLVRYITGGLNPVLSAPLQIGAGTEFFSGRSIGPEGQGDIPLSEFAAGQFRPVRELGLVGVRKSPLGKAFAEGAGPGTARLLAGGRAQPFSDERIAQAKDREYKDRFEGLRRAVTIAEREGDHERSLRFRVQLLATFRAAKADGVKTPKWAEKWIGEPAPA